MKIININIGIVDDMEYAAKVVKSFIRSSVYSKGQDINIYTYTSSQDVMISATQIKFDILFMDIDLGDHISGINIAYKIKEIYPDCLIIYMSGYNHFYSDMVKNELFGFLEKPIDIDEFNRLFKKAIDRINNIYKKYEFKYNGIHMMVYPYQIMYAYSSLRKCNLVLNSGEILSFYEKINNLEKDLKEIYPHFIRVNKSFLVNSLYIKSYKKDAVIMNDGLELKVSRSYRDSFFNEIFKEI